RIEPSLQAVFVDYGNSRNGFLSINDIHSSYFPESFESSRKKPRIQDVFKKDDHVIVQVIKEERHSKGAGLTTNISLAGRYLVLMPGTDLCGVSRKIEDETERKKLKDILKQLTPPENMGFIIRTAGMGRTKTELSRDLNYLLKLWNTIEKNVVNFSAPALLYKEPDLVVRSIREHFEPDINEILVDDKEVYKRAREFFRQVMPKYEGIVKLYQEKRPLFNKYQLEEQIELVYQRRIKLKSGGYILIEPTEAMVTIDVNSGSATKEKGIEDTAYYVNMEAAPEIARQLRLRDLGGIIVIDFIDMSSKKHLQDVEKQLKNALKTDRAKTKVLKISSLGVLELSRQRIKSSLGEGEYHECPLCEGRGRVRSIETTALSVFRRIKSALAKGDVVQVRATAPPKVSDYLLNNMRSKIVELESQFGARVTISSKHAIVDNEIVVEALKEQESDFATIEAPSLISEIEFEFSHETEIPDTIDKEAIVEEKIEKVTKQQRRRRRTRKKPTSAAEVPGGVEEGSELSSAISQDDHAGSSSTSQKFIEKLDEQQQNTDVNDTVEHSEVYKATVIGATEPETSDKRQSEQRSDDMGFQDPLVSTGESRVEEHAAGFETKLNEGTNDSVDLELNENPFRQTLLKNDTPGKKVTLQDFLPFS
ncbi:MAG: ribonuclease E/G, partial [Desulfomonilaceae bacterium]